MSKLVKCIIFLCAVLAVLVAVTTGWNEDVLSGLHPYQAEPIVSVSQGWRYRAGDVEGEAPPLPCKLPGVQNGIFQVTLYNTMPQDIPNESILRFSSMCQRVEIYIGGELRLSYGSTAVSQREFPYISGTHISVLPLYASDAGKDIELRLGSIPLYHGELTLIRAVEIGPHAQFILRDIRDHSVLWVCGIVGLVTSAFLLIVWLVQLLRKTVWRLPLAFSILTLLWVLFAVEEMPLTWAFAQYSPLYSAYGELRFYVLDGLLPILTYILLLQCDREFFSKAQMRLVIAHALVFILAAALHAMGITSINIFRSLLMAISFASYTWLFIGSKLLKRRDNKLFLTGIFVLMAGYFLDYAKYFVTLFPLHESLSKFFYFDFSYTFFLSVSLLMFCIVTFMAIVYKFAADKARVQTELDLSNLHLQMTNQRYQDILDSDYKMRRIRHDTVHHIRTITALFSQGNTRQAQEYAERICGEASSAHAQQYCRNHVADITLSWFASQAKRLSVDFACAANIPHERLSCDMELCTVLSNALQNALDACGYVEKAPFVYVEIRLQKSMLFLLIKNSYDGTMRKLSGTILSRKKDSGHGYGLTTIRSIADASGGRCKAEYDESVFTLDVVIANAEPLLQNG